MPWMITEENGMYCVHKKNPDGTAGELIKCHKTRHEAEAHMAALYANDTESVVMTVDMVNIGGEVKALGNGKIGGYLIRFGDWKNPDLHGEYFSKETDFGDAETTPVYYGHGFDPTLGLKILAYKASLKKDDIGVWIEAQLSLRDEYERAIYGFVEMNKMGWSSGTAGHLVVREISNDGMNVFIKRWPLGLDASLTPAPAEPQNMVESLKTALENLKAANIFPVIENIDKNEVNVYNEQVAIEGEAEVPITDTLANSETVVIESNPTLKESITMDITEEKLGEIVQSAANDAADKAATKAYNSFIGTLQPDNATELVVTKDEADQPWNTAGEYFKAVKMAALAPYALDRRLKALEVKATGLSEGVPTDGGFLVPPQFAPGILEKMYSIGELLSRISIDPIEGNSMTYNAVSETSRADGSRYGGVRGYWMAEGGTKTASKPVFEQIDLKLKKVAALCYATDELLEDANALASWLMRTVPDELSFQAEAAIYRGDGVGKPLGILSSPCLVSASRYTLLLISVDDIARMLARRWARARDYVWLINTDVMPQLVQLGSTTHPVWMPSLREGIPSTLMGLPVVEIEYASTLGTVGDIMLASLSQYQAITKGGIQAATSIHVQFTTDETAFRFVYRIDGQPMWSSALTPYQGTNTLSPFVVLATATA